MLIHLGDGSKLDRNPDNDDLTQTESKIMEYFTANKEKFNGDTELQVYQLIFLKNAFQINQQNLQLKRSNLKNLLKQNDDMLRLAVSANLGSENK